ncbi:complement C1q-like protein 3 [Ostrea edulis]|uniref:complement C1q-like protein 3 n=1 Tax=Ostrea edulis TaxID=37623 RepID=UPI0024AFD08A|nr:complement C1q-like protein 3 [Ostrea edulis]
MKKLEELQKVVDAQADRISLLETNDIKRMRELHNLKDTVNNQRKHISTLEKRHRDLESIVTAQAKDLVRQTELGDENLIKISVLQKRQQLCENPDTTAASTNDIATAFYAYLSNNIISPGGHHILTFDTVITNTRNVYHPTSGTFIVPRSGLYVFTWTIRMNGQGSQSTELLVNSNVVGITFFHPGNVIDGSVSGTIVVHVNQGDDVLLRTSASIHSGGILSDSNGRSWFAGWALM